MFEIKFREAIQATGIEFRGDIISDGNIHRCHVEGDHAGSKNGWYVLHSDEVPSGAFGCFKRDISGTWASKDTQTMTDEEKSRYTLKIEAARQQRAKEEEQVRADCRKWCNDTFEKAKAATNDHPYLKKKGVHAYGVKQLRESLLIPLRDGAAVIHGIQFIKPDGTKNFKTGTAKPGNYFSIGKPKENTLFISEGYATGASLHKATGHAVAIAFDAGNLLSVGKSLRTKFPGIRLVICADNDESGVGQKKAKEAALAIGGVVVIPPEIGDDFNDMHQKEGLEAVKASVLAASGQQKQENPKVHAKTVDLIRGSDLTPEPIDWIWHGWLAAGKMHVFGGAPGTGKTTIAVALAATITIGGRWPDGNKSNMGNVVIWSGEDDPADTLVPRLALSGADLSKVYFISSVREGTEKRSFDPAKDIDTLCAKLKDIQDVRLLIVDPIVSAITGDSHKNAEVRRDLQPLVDLAAAMDCALLGITHFSKGTGGRDPVERLTGSLAFGALARVVFIAAKHQKEGDDGKTIRIFVRAKSNIGPDDGGFEYDLTQGEMRSHPGILSSYVSWGDSLQGSARDLLSTAEIVTQDDGKEDAVRWLRELLEEEREKVSLQDVKKAARQFGISESSLYRARRKLGVNTEKSGFGKDKKSFWSLPLLSTKAPLLPILPTNLTDSYGSYGESNELENAEVF